MIKSLIKRFSLFMLISMATTSYGQEIKAFSSIDENSPSQMEFALMYAQKFFQASSSAKFIILCGGKGIHLLQKENTQNQPKIAQLIDKHPNFQLFACKETTDKMEKYLGKDSINFIEGTKIVSCSDKWKELTEGRWYKIDTSSIDE